MERSDNEIIYPWSNVNEYRDRESIDTMRILFLRSSSLLLCFSSRLSISFSFSLILFNSLVPSPLTPLFYSFPSLFTPASSTSSNWTLSSPFSQCGPRSASFDTYSHTFFHAHTHTHNARVRARTHLFENWCHEARGERKIHRYTYIDAGCTLTRLLSVCSRQLITTCASLGKYSVN